MPIKSEFMERVPGAPIYSGNEGRGWCEKLCRSSVETVGGHLSVELELMERVQQRSQSQAGSRRTAFVSDQLRHDVQALACPAHRSLCPSL